MIFVFGIPTRNCPRLCDADLDLVLSSPMLAGKYNEVISLKNGESGRCRSADNNEGSYRSLNLKSGAKHEDCAKECDKFPKCLAYHFKARNAYCQLYGKGDSFAWKNKGESDPARTVNQDRAGFVCYQRYYYPETSALVTCTFENRM